MPALSQLSYDLGMLRPTQSRREAIEEFRFEVDGRSWSCTYCGGCLRPEQCWACEHLHPGAYQCVTLVESWALGPV